MAIVVLIGTVNEGLKLWYIIRVSKIDHIDSHVILSEAFAETLKLDLLLIEWVSTENDDARFRILIHTMFE